MKTYFTIATLVFGTAFAANAGVEGLWRSEKNEQGASISVAISKCGDAICGTVAEIQNSSDHSAMNKAMIKGMKSSDNVHYAGGKIYAPDQEKWYIAKMQLQGDSKLKVSGCVLGGVICRSQVWTRE